MKRRSFEEALPEGYVPRLTVDCQDKKLGILMNLAALAIMAVLCVVFWRLIQPRDAFLAAPLTSLLKTAVFMVAVSAYIVLHELLHGAAYKLLTGRKLTFGLTWSVAYCGVPDIFVYRSAALVALGLTVPFARNLIGLADVKGHALIVVIAVAVSVVVCVVGRIALELINNRKKTGHEKRTAA